MKDRDEPQFTDSLKRVSGIAWQGLEYRIDLLAAEFQEDKRRFVVLVALAQVALFSAFMAFLCVNVLVFVVFWDTHRTAVAVIMSAVYLAITIVIGAYVRLRSKSAPRPFAATLEELKKDRAALTRANP
jgi:uncharacterized membrane protein YqjE